MILNLIYLILATVDLSSATGTLATLYATHEVFTAEKTLVEEVFSQVQHCTIDFEDENNYYISLSQYIGTSFTGNEQRAQIEASHVLADKLKKTGNYSRLPSISVKLVKQYKFGFEKEHICYIFSYNKKKLTKHKIKFKVVAVERNLKGDVVSEKVLDDAQIIFVDREGSDRLTTAKKKISMFYNQKVRYRSIYDGYVSYDNSICDTNQNVCTSYVFKDTMTERYLWYKSLLSRFTS